jgi:hypothetical protein
LSKIYINFLYDKLRLRESNKSVDFGATPARAVKMERKCLARRRMA